MGEDNRQEIIGLSEATQRLIASDEWQLVMEEVFYKAHAVTTAKNCAFFNRDSRAGMVEQLLARGILNKFLTDIIEDGAQASASIDEDDMMEEHN